MGHAKSAITKITNRAKKNIPGSSYTRSHGYRHSIAFICLNNKYVYISCDDDSNRVLVRAAKDEKDFTGGQNHFAELGSGKYEFDKVLKLINELIKKETSC